MNGKSDQQQTANLLYHLLEPVKEQAKQWLSLVRREPSLAAFLGVNFIAFTAMIAINYQRAHRPVWEMVVALPIIWSVFYGGVFLAFTFVARTTKTRENPAARFPGVELLGLLLYLFGFLFTGIYLVSHGQAHLLTARGVVGMTRAFDALNSAVLSAVGLGVDAARLEFLRSFDCIFLFPAALLFACCNSPKALGFRMPLSARWTILIWAALPLYNLLTAAAKGGNALAGVIGALVFAGLSEEFTFRAGLQTRIEIALGSPVKAIVLSSVLFGLTHLTAPHPDPIWAVCNAFGAKAFVGFFLGYLYYRTRSLLPGILVHGALDVMMFAGGT